MKRQEMIDSYVNQGAERGMVEKWDNHYSIEEIIRYGNSAAIGREQIARTIGILFNLSFEHAKHIVNRVL